MDNDGENSFTDSIIHKAAKRLIDSKKEVFIAIPEQISKGVKTDFNDVARNAGIGTVKKVLDNAVTYKEWKSTMEKNKQHQINEIIPNIANKIIQKDHAATKLYTSLFKNSEIILNVATKLVYSEQKDLSMQKNISIPKNLNTQKTLSKNELEIC